MATPHRGDIGGWHPEILPRATRRALDTLSQQPWLRRSPWYLAGGTALALRAGHRSSLDLDFFSPRGNFSPARLVEHFPKTHWKTSTVSEGTVFGSLFGGKVSFIAYPFFRVRKQFHWYGSVRVLDPADIAVMKIIAVSQRGRKRDFVDLYWYCTNREPLEAVVRRLPDQYPTVAHTYHHILESLTYFADAEPDPMPRLLFGASWKDMKQFFEREVPKVTRELLGLT